MPDLNYETPAVKDSMFNIADYWIKNVGIDGFRLDAVIHIFEEPGMPANSERNFPFWAAFSARVKAANPEAFNVGEAWTEGTYMRRYVTEGKLDYVFDFDLAGAILSAVNNGRSGSLGRVLQTAYDGFPFLQIGTFLTNHDQNRVANVLGNNIGRMKAAASLYLTMPGIPYLYYGEEIGMTGQKPDEDIRRPMQWTSGTNSGFTNGNPWRGVNADFTTKNVALQQADNTSLWHHYRKLIEIRNNETALRRGTLQILTPSSDAVFAFRREIEGENGAQVVVLQNLSGNMVTDVRIPASFSQSKESFSNQVASIGQWEDLFNPGSTVYANNGQLTLTLAPHETRILKLQVVLPANERASGADAFVLLGNFPNPFNPSTTIRFQLPVATEVRLEILDLSGRVVQQPLISRLPAGSHAVQVSLGALSSGVYLYRVSAGNAVKSGKMTLLK
jgi:hypothetical protein